MKKYTFFNLFILIFIITSCVENASETEQSIDTERISVKTYQLDQHNRVTSVIGTGILSTNSEVQYSFKIGGVIEKILVEEGDQIRKGQLLAAINTTEINAAYQQANLGFEKAERDFNRVSNLYKEKVATLEQLQNAKTAIDIAKEQLETVRFNKKYTSIYATSNGFVTRKLGNVGEIIGGGMPVLVVNEPTNNEWVLKMGISDKEWALIETGNSADVILDAYSERVLKGTVLRKSLAADLQSGSFQIEISVNCKDLEPALGMFGKAKISTNKTKSTTKLPYDALIEADGNSAFVFVPLPKGKVRKQAIEIESFDNDFVHVKNGLQNIKEVVLTNSAFLNENSIIQVINQ
jgi:RND family efflux transporter MFP subunit